MKELDFFGRQGLLDDVTDAEISQHDGKREEDLVSKSVVPLRRRCIWYERFPVNYRFRLLVKYMFD